MEPFRRNARHIMAVNNGIFGKTKDHAKEMIDL